MHCILQTLLGRFVPDDSNLEATITIQVYREVSDKKLVLCRRFMQVHLIEQGLGLLLIKLFIKQLEKKENIFIIYWVEFLYQ